MLPPRLQSPKPLSKRDVNWLTLLQLAGQVERQGRLCLDDRDRPETSNLVKMLWTGMVWRTKRNRQHHGPLLSEQRDRIAGQEDRWAEHVRGHLTTTFRLQYRSDKAQALTTYIALVALLQQYLKAQE